VVGDLRPAGIEKVTLRLNDGTEIEVPVDLLGNFSVTIDGLVLGADDKVVATVTATDGTTAVAEAVLLEDEGVVVEPAPLGPPPGEAATVLVAAPAAQGAETLPATGSDSGRLALVASGLVLAGLAAVGASRRMRTS